MVAENVFLLRYRELRGEFARILSVLNLRDSEFDPGIVRCSITSEGISLGPRIEDRGGDPDRHGQGG